MRLVFTTPLGTPLDLNNVRKKNFYPLLDRAGLLRMRLYDLRHSAATLRLLNGDHPKVVQEMLGHASITLTMDTYSHVLPEMQEESAVRLDALLGGEAGSAERRVGSLAVNLTHRASAPPGRLIGDS